MVCELWLMETKAWICELSSWPGRLWTLVARERVVGSEPLLSGLTSGPRLTRRPRSSRWLQSSGSCVPLQVASLCWAPEGLVTMIFDFLMALACLLQTLCEAMKAFKSTRVSIPSAALCS